MMSTRKTKFVSSLNKLPPRDTHQHAITIHIYLIINIYQTTTSIDWNPSTSFSKRLHHNIQAKAKRVMGGLRTSEGAMATERACTMIQEVGQRDTQRIYTSTFTRLFLDVNNKK
jgi:hypothetical protein